MCPGVGLLDHMVSLFLFFWGTSILFFIVAASISILIDINLSLDQTYLRSRFPGTHLHIPSAWDCHLTLTISWTPFVCAFRSTLCLFLPHSMPWDTDFSGFPILWFLSLSKGSPGWRSVGKTTSQGIYSPSSVPWILGLTLVRQALSYSFPSGLPQ